MEKKRECDLPDRAYSFDSRKQPPNMPGGEIGVKSRQETLSWLVLKLVPIISMINITAHLRTLPR